jgi:hypothetical protein
MTAAENNGLDMVEAAYRDFQMEYYLITVRLIMERTMAKIATVSQIPTIIM